MKDDLLEQFQQWHAGEEPPSRLKCLLGRISEDEKWRIEGDSYITAARIRDRGYRFAKTNEGCTFEITRHPGSFTLHHVTRRVVQKWEADIYKKRLRLLSKRDWTPSDPDH